MFWCQVWVPPWTSTWSALTLGLKIVATIIAGTIQLGVQSWWVHSIRVTSTSITDVLDLKDVFTYPVSSPWLRSFRIQQLGIPRDVCSPHQKDKSVVLIPLVFIRTLNIVDTQLYMCWNKCLRHGLCYRRSIIGGLGIGFTVSYSGASSDRHCSFQSMGFSSA